jgi:hypothetical protein
MRPSGRRATVAIQHLRETAFRSTSGLPCGSSTTHTIREIRNLTTASLGRMEPGTEPFVSVYSV